MKNNKLIVISGPTATGKTKTSISLAQMLIDRGFACEIVNFDSLYFYREISIGTAKPTMQERQGIIHHMIDVESILSPMNASDFINQAKNIIVGLFAQNKVVILVGGSAFYLRALLKGMYESPSPDPLVKKEMENLYQTKGIEAIVEYLQKHDPESLVNLHANDHYRLIRAAEHHRMTGEKMSVQKKLMDQQNPYDFSKCIHDWDVLHLYLDVPKEEHYKIIQQRTVQMFADGLMEEIETLEKQGFSLDLKPLQSIGYKEAILLRQGQFSSLDDCIERISISTRQLAKSQRTFFNKIHPKESFNPLTDFASIKERVNTFVK